MKQDGKREDGIREKTESVQNSTVMFNPDDSVRQALAEDFMNQCKELGIEVKTEVVVPDGMLPTIRRLSSAIGMGAGE